MKSIVSLIAVPAIICLFSCNNQENASKAAAPETSSAQAHASDAHAKETKTIAAAFTTVDPLASKGIHGIIGHYLAIKNALASDDAQKASDAAGMLGAALQKVDKSLLTAEQKTAYDKTEDVIRLQASQIAEAGGDIAKQRSSFFPLSESMYELAKQFGGGRPLYHDHCPMARDNQGALWISEEKDIRNPYFGAGMLTCGTVEEIIQ